MQKYLMEFVGTFFLILIIGLTGNPVAIGAVLAALIYMGGYISGAHYNPAVTLAVWLRGKIESQQATWYVVTQLVAGFVAAIVLFAFRGVEFVPHPGTGDFFTSVLVEIVFTFLLASVVLHTATAEFTAGNHYYGIAIGLALMVGAFAGGPISGGAYNPAVAVGPILLDIKHIVANFPNLLIYLIGPLVGASLAAMAFKFISSSNTSVPEDEEVPLPPEPENGSITEKTTGSIFKG